MKTFRLLIVAGAIFVTGLGISMGADANWPQFRGPGGKGVGHSPTLPDHWSTSENVAWKAEIPGEGWSSPVVWGDRIFLTTSINSSQTESPKKGLYFGGERRDAPRTEHEWKVLCLDLSAGKSIWAHTVKKAAPAGPIHVKNTYASETPVTDGERIYAYFGNLGIFCLNMQGDEVWSHPIEAHKMKAGWGTASSPVLHGDRLYVVNDNDEQSYILALDKKTGKEIWKVDREEKSNWSTPFVWENEKRTEIVTAGTGRVRSYDLDGKLLWSLKGMSSITIGTPYSENGLLYISSGYVMDKSRPIYAIKPGASGDISLETGQTNNASIAWCQPTGAPYNPTSLAYDKKIYVLYDSGLMSAFDANTGAVYYHRERLPEGMHFTAAPFAYNGRVYCLNEDGLTFVVKAGEKFELLHTNKLGEDDMAMATPAISGDRLLIRTVHRLYCMRDQSNKPRQD